MIIIIEINLYNYDIENKLRYNMRIFDIKYTCNINKKYKINLNKFSWK